MQAAVESWTNLPATTECHLQQQQQQQCQVQLAPSPAQQQLLGGSGPVCLSNVPQAAAASEGVPPGAIAAVNMPPQFTQTAGTAPAAATAAFQAGGAPIEPVERQGSLADLLFQILDDEDTDGMLLADLHNTSRAMQQQQRGPQAAAQPQQPPLLQQLQQRKLLERLQAKQQQQQPQGDADIFAMRDPANATSSSLAASAGIGTGGSSTPWPSFTSTAGQPGPGAAALFGTNADDSTANAAAPTVPGAAAAAGPAAQNASSAGAALIQQLQLRARGLPASLPVLKAAASAAEEALTERQAMKRQLLQQLLHEQDDVSHLRPSSQQQQQQDQTAAAGTAAALQQQQQQQQQGDALQPGINAAAVPNTGVAAAAAAAGSPAPAGVQTNTAGGNTAAAAAAGPAAAGCSAATAAALLAEAGDDLLDMEFLESMLQDNACADGVLGDLARMASFPVQMQTGSLVTSFHQQQQQQAKQQQQQPGAFGGADPNSLTGQMHQASLAQQQQQQQQQMESLASMGPVSQPMNGTVMGMVGMQPQQTAFAATAAAGADMGQLGPAAAAVGCGMQPASAPSMDSGLRSAMGHLGRLQIPSPSGDLGAVNSLQGPMSIDAARPGGLDQAAGQGLASRNGLLGQGYAQNPLGQLQQMHNLGAVGGSGTRPPLPACSSRSGVGPSVSVPDESNGSVVDDAAEAMSDGEVEQSASGRRTSARMRSRLALAKQKRQQQKAQQGVAAAKPDTGVPSTPAQPSSQPQVAPGGMLSLLLNGGSNGNSMGNKAAAASQQMQIDLQQQQIMLQSYGSAPHPGAGLGLEGQLSPLLSSAASMGQLGLTSPCGNSQGCMDLLSILPKEQITQVLSSLPPSALQQLLELQKRQPALARIVLKRTLRNMQGQPPQDGLQQQLQQQLQQLQQPLPQPQQQQQQGLVGFGLDGSGPSAAAPAGSLGTSPAAAAAPAGGPAPYKARQPGGKVPDLPNGTTSQGSRRGKAPLVFYKQRGKTMTNLGAKPSSSQQPQPQRAASACLGGDFKQDLLSPTQHHASAAAAGGGGGGGGGGLDVAALQQLDPAMAAALVAPAGNAGPGAAAPADTGALHGSRSSSDIASSDGNPVQQPHQQQPTSSSRRLGKRARQITQNDLSGVVAAAAAAAAAGNCNSNPMEQSNASLPGGTHSGAVPFMSMQGTLQMQLQNGLVEAMQMGYEEASGADHPSAAGLATLFGAANTSAATGSTGSAGVVADAAVITQQARALVRILTKLNTQQLIQTRTMLHSVLQRSAPGLLDHMAAIERMINQLVTLKQQPMMPQQQQQQQQMMMQGTFGSMFAAAGGLGMGFGDGLMQGQQQQGQQLQTAAVGLQQQQQQQHLMQWPNDPFVQQQQQQPQAQHQLLLQSQLQSQLQQQSPWGIASSLSGPQPVQWNSQSLLQQPDPSSLAAGTAAPEDETEQSAYQLATRRQQGRRCKPKPDEQAQQQQQQQCMGLQMAASAPASLPQPSAAAVANAVSLGMTMSQQQQPLQMQQQQQMLAEMQQQQQRMQHLQQQQQQLQQQQMQMQQQNMGFAVTQGMQQQQQQPSNQVLGAPGGPSIPGEGLVMDAVQEQQQEDQLLSWLQNDELEGWPDGQDMGILTT